MNSAYRKNRARGKYERPRQRARYEGGEDDLTMIWSFLETLI